MINIEKKKLEKLNSIFDGVVSEWKLSLQMRSLSKLFGIADPNKLLQYLLESKLIYRSKIIQPAGAKRYVYSIKESLSIYDVAYNLWPATYFCNFTAIYYHKLTNQIPHVAYVAREGKGRFADQRKAKRINLTNEQIFQAFLKPHRNTSAKYELESGSIILTERSDRGCVGVISVRESNTFLAKSARVASLERALIDACINPHYNGGILSVVDYYRKAVNRIKEDELIKIYRSLDLVYPYWQAIGFICDLVNAKNVADSIYGAFKANNDFYLDHEAKTSWEFNEKWRIYHPRII